MTALPKFDLPDPCAAFCEARGWDVVKWGRMHGGRTNASWQLTTENAVYVFKRFDHGRSNPVFPNDIDAEKRALDHLSGRSLAPQLIGRIEDHDTPWLVYEYVEGAHPAAVDQLTIASLGALHAIAPPSGLRRLPQTARQITEQASALLADAGTALASRVEALKPKGEEVALRPSAFLHGDATPANTVMAGEGAVFVDWQCPALGDPVFDLAIALSPAMHVLYAKHVPTEREREAALGAYPVAETVERYRRLAPLLSWRMAAYCAWQVSRGATDYAAALEAELSR